MYPSQKLIDDLLPGEKIYPIFDARASWIEDIDGRDFRPQDAEGLPDGRIRNRRSWYEMINAMTADKIADSIINKSTKEWWPENQEKHKSRNLTDLKITVEFKRWETWCLNWFHHWTWDIGLSDSDVLESFTRYVERTQQLNREEGKMVDGYFQEPYCLMGAEDRHRWRGDVEEAPCRCWRCKRRGVVTIDH